MVRSSTLLAAAVVVALTGFAGSAGAATYQTFEVPGISSTPTATGVTVPPEGVTISCTGRVVIRPDGYSVGCGSTGGPEPQYEKDNPLPNGTKLIARVGGGAWQSVGSGPTVVKGTGELELMFNDSYYEDNTGSFTATVKIGLSILGRVTKLDGSPASGVQISAQGPGGGSAASGANGGYEIPISQPGVYTVTAAGDYCAVGVQPCSKFRKVQLPPDQTVNFVERDPLKVDVTLTPDSLAANGLGMIAAVIAVTDDGRPAAGQNVRIQPNAGQNPRSVVCENGTRVWPERFADGSLGTSGFNRSTDGQGLIGLDVLVGTNPGSWNFAAALASRQRVFDFASATFTGAPGGLPPNLINQIAPVQGQRQAFGMIQLSASRIGRPGEDGSRDQDALLEWLTTLKARGRLDAEFAPIMGGGGGPAVVFYPLNADATQLERHMRFGGAIGMEARVLDLETAQKINAGRVRPDQAAFPRLEQWEAAKNSFLPASFGRQQPRPSDSFTFMGFPYPPVAAVNGASRSGMNCLGGGSGMAVTAHSPVKLLLRRGKKEFGFDGRGRLRKGIPGSVVLRNLGPHTETYIVPRGRYSVHVTGTGRGKATLDFSAPGRDPQVFNLTGVRRGASGRVGFGPKGAARSIKFRGRRVRARRGLAMRLKGLPKTLRPNAARTLALVVRDQFGQPVVGAEVTASGPGVRAVGVTVARGRVQLPVAPAASGKVRVTVNAGGYLPLRRSVTVR